MWGVVGRRNDTCSSHWMCKKAALWCVCYRLTHAHTQLCLCERVCLCDIVCVWVRTPKVCCSGDLGQDVAITFFLPDERAFQWPADKCCTIHTVFLHLFFFFRRQSTSLQVGVSVVRRYSRAMEVGIKPTTNGSQQQLKKHLNGAVTRSPR